MQRIIINTSLKVFWILIFSIPNAIFGQTNYTRLKDYYQLLYDESYNDICAELPNGCDSIPDLHTSNLTFRACAVQEFLQQDSIMSNYLDSLVYEIESLNDTVLLQSFNSLQLNWSNYIVNHGYMIGRKYQFSSSGHTKSLVILDSSLFMIELRIKELGELLNFYRKTDY